RIMLEGGVRLIDDCYNANPMSMRAALQDLAASAQREGAARRVAVLGDMLELGPQEREFHLGVGDDAEAAEVDVLIAVGPRAAAQVVSTGAISTGPVSGRVLIAGTASLLMCLFLSPRFIAFVRRREFGQNIREEGPVGHQTKAGTPTLGGIIIFVAFAIPFLV